MAHSLISLHTTTLPLFILTLFIALFHPFVHAQKFQPIPVSSPCSTFVEGQGLYVLGGLSKGNNVSNQAFMLDLSVSWNTNSPVFKELPDIPGSGSPSTCTMTSNGEILSTYAGFHLYNVKSGPKTWTEIPNTPTTTAGVIASTIDPGSGLIYNIDPPNYMSNYTGKFIVANLNTMTFKESSLPGMNAWNAVAWSSPLRSLMVYSYSLSSLILYMFTPSDANSLSHGWKELNTTGAGFYGSIDPCFMPAYNGSKMVVFTRTHGGSVYILDLATLTWTPGPPLPPLTGTACAVSGDQVIIWGGRDDKLNRSNETYIYNMKTETWTSRYISPSDTPLPTTSGSQTPTSTTTTTDASDTSSSNRKRAINIGIATGVLIVFVLVVVSVCIGYRMRPRSDTRSTGVNWSISDVVSADREPSEGSLRVRDPVYPSSEPGSEPGSGPGSEPGSEPDSVSKGSIAGQGRSQ